MARKERIRILIGHTDEHIKAQCKKLLLFEPHDLRSLISEARGGGDTGLEQAVVLAFNERNQRQTVDLLRRLGIDPSQPDVWQKGFLRYYHYGVGRLAWQPLRTNRKAATWTPSNDLNLIMEVTKLKADGFSEPKAIKRILSDPRTRRLFPYREQKNRAGSDYSSKYEVKKREAALWRRLQYLKASSAWNSILDQLLGPGWNAKSSSESALYALDSPIYSPKEVMKNRRPR
jgi:hypothetical protein